MKAFRILKNNIIESFQGVFRNFSLSMASISCITITLILVGFSILLTENVNYFTKGVEEDLTIVVFLERKIDNETILDVRKTIDALDNVKSTEFEYTEETNPLQDTILVKVDDINYIGKTAGQIEKLEHVDIVKYGEGSVEELIKIFDLVKKIMYAVVAALVLVTAFLISNTIKITIQSRSREIEIRRLVGASNAFIRQPFFFEGIILGFIGSIIPILGCCLGYKYLYEKMGGRIFTDIIRLVTPNSVYQTIIVTLIAIGVVVGAFGSYRAVRKYLKI